jgi:hypothetical protein
LRELELQVVAIAVFSALGFAFYVFFVPFVGTRPFQIVAMTIYTPLVRFLPCFSETEFAVRIDLALWVTGPSGIASQVVCYACCILICYKYLIE